MKHDSSVKDSSAVKLHKYIGQLHKDLYGKNAILSNFEKSLEIFRTIPNDIANCEPLNTSAIKDTALLEKNIRYFNGKLTKEQIEALKIIKIPAKEIDNLKVLIFSQARLLKDLAGKLASAENGIGLSAGKNAVSVCIAKQADYTRLLNYELQVIRSSQLSDAMQGSLGKLDEYLEMERALLEELGQMITHEYPRLADLNSEQLLIELEQILIKLHNLEGKKFDDSEIVVNYALTYISANRNYCISRIGQSAHSKMHIRVPISEILWAYDNIKALGADTMLQYVAQKPLSLILKSYFKVKVDFKSQDAINQSNSAPAEDASKASLRLSQGKIAAKILAHGAAASFRNLVAPLTIMPLWLLMPKSLQAKLLHFMFSKNTLNQLPGLTIPDFLLRFSPSAMKIRSYMGQVDFIVGTQLYQLYDIQNDCFRQLKGQHKEFNLDFLSETTNAIEFLKLYCRNIIELEAPCNGSGLVELPQLFPRFSDRYVVMPIAASHKSDPKRFLKLSYDEYHRVFVENDKAGPGSILVSYICLFPDNPIDKKITMKARFIEDIYRHNKGYISKSPELNGEQLLKAKSMLPAEVETKFSQVMQSGQSINEKVESLSKFMKEYIKYPRPFDYFKLARNSKRNSIETILAARIGNCYDANKIGFYLLSRMGLSVQLCSCLALSKYRNNVSKRSKLSLVEGKIYESAVPLECDQALMSGHAVLLYFDSERECFTMVDFTPPTKPKSRSPDNKHNDEYLKYQHIFLEYNIPVDIDHQIEASKHPLTYLLGLWNNEIQPSKSGVEWDYICKNNFGIFNDNRPNVYWYSYRSGRIYPFIRDCKNADHLIHQIQWFKVLSQGYLQNLDKLESISKLISDTLQPLCKKAVDRTTRFELGLFLDLGLQVKERALRGFPIIDSVSRQDAVDILKRWICINCIKCPPEVSVHISENKESKIRVKFEEPAKKNEEPAMSSKEFVLQDAGSVVQLLSHLTNNWENEIRLTLQKIAQVLSDEKRPLMDSDVEELKRRIESLVMAANGARFQSDRMLPYPYRLLNFEVKYDDEEFQKWAAAVNLSQKDIYILNIAMKKAVVEHRMPVIDALYFAVTGKYRNKMEDVKRFFPRLKQGRTKIEQINAKRSEANVEPKK